MKRLSRRRLIAGAAVLGAAGAGAAVIGLTSRGEGPNKVAPAPSESPTLLPTVTATSTPAPFRGGDVRLAAPSGFDFDTFDSQLTGEPSVVEVLGRTHSRLLQWTDFAAPSLGGDIAARWEQPDATTLILHIRPGVRWHGQAPLDGRPLTAADCVAHIERARQLAQSGGLPLSQRAWEYSTIASVTAPGTGEVVIKTSRPDPFLLQTLAGRFALVQAPGAIEAFAGRWHKIEPQTVVGTGPFIFQGFTENGALRFEAHRNSHAPPLLGGLEVSQPFGAAGRFLAGEIGEALTRDRRDAALLRSEAGGATELARFEDSPIISSLFVGAPPWNNVNLRRALSAALNRAEIVRRLFAGRAAPSGPIAPALPSFALPETALARFPGYRARAEDDAREARALWQAGGGPALGTVTVDFPSIFDPLYSASSVVIGMLNEALGGNQFRPAVESYVNIARKASEGRYGSGNAAFWFGWGPHFPGPDPGRFLIENYRSGSSGAAASGFGDAAIDALLDRLGAEVDEAARRALVSDVQTGLLESGGGGLIDWVVQRAELFRSPRLGNRPSPTPFWDQHLDAGTFLNTAGAGG